MDAYLSGLQRYNDALVAYQADLDTQARQQTTQRLSLPVQRVVQTSGDWASFAACVIAHESGGNPSAQNPTSSASGLFQDLDSTWGGYGGYAHAKDAPVEVQYARNEAIYAGGAGRSNWNGTGC